MAEDAARGTRSRENTRARLFEAAAEVFAEIGADAASVEVITDRAGFTRGAFYSNFESKDDLFFELLTWVTERKLTDVTERVREMETQGVRDMSVPEILARILEVTVDQPLGVRLMSEFRTRAMRDARTAEAYIAWKSGMNERVAGIVADLARAADIHLTLPAGELADMVLYIWEGTSVQAVIEGRDEKSMEATIRDRTVAVVTALVAQQTAD